MVLGKERGRPRSVCKRRKEVTPNDSDVAKGIQETNGGKYAYKL